MDFYKSLMGTTYNNMMGVDIVSMRIGKQLNKEQITTLISKVCEKEVEIALRSIGDLTAPGIDGYGSKLFKHSWNMVKDDVINTVRNFFDEDKGWQNSGYPYPQK
ncbi:unnamed protein product [Vicia faba]|uniref:Uncharacterized protein n=1 Tax=Vicia faba TaxID=3906 RepID=A0AAV1AWV6_VICFA|nr:unnamed protein product [Vicia faba]